MMRVEVTRDVLRWASERAARDGVDAQARFPRLAAWETGSSQPTVKQLEAFAKATHTPIGTYFLPTPPTESLPITDFRVGPAFRADLPSGNLLDTIYACQRRQDWFSEHARLERFDPVPWVGTYTPADSPIEAAAEMRRRLHFEPTNRRSFADWKAGHRELVARIETEGVLVSTSGVVGNSTQRRLDPTEFRGFCLTEVFAPLIFINGADLKAAQSFTLCHELAHLALGQSGLSAEDPGTFHEESVEAWCDDFATEFLVPSSEVLPDALGRDTVERASRLSQSLRVSPLVSLRQIVKREKLDSKTIARDFARLRERLIETRSGGGNFHATALLRVGRKFARSVIESTLEGRTTYVEAFRLLGIKAGLSFDELASRMGLQP